MKQTKRKVRKDFDPTREYSVDVSKCTQQEKKEVQQAFFDVGIAWIAGGNTYKYLDAACYTNKHEDGGVVHHLLCGGTTEDCNMTAQQFLDIVYEPVQTGHIHAELMAMYAEDAKTNTEPWRLWQFKSCSGWANVPHHPSWDTTTDYRRKPKTHFVHGVEIPDLRAAPEPELGEQYYLVDPTETELTELYTFDGDSYGNPLEKLWVERGLIYQNTEEGKQAAILHAKAMLGMVE